MARQYLSDIRLCVTGSSNVGKSAITVRFLTQRFIGEYQRDVEGIYDGCVSFGLDTIKFEIKDSRSSTEKNIQTSASSSWPTCIAVIYAINEVTSFTIAGKILDELESVMKEKFNDIPIALVGNKCDLKHLRKVSELDGRTLAEKHGASFWESSAADDYHSTYRPLHSLIVDSFVKTNGAENSKIETPIVEEEPKKDIDQRKRSFDLARRCSAPETARFNTAVSDHSKPTDEFGKRKMDCKIDSNFLSPGHPVQINRHNLYASRSINNITTLDQLDRNQEESSSTKSASPTRLSPLQVKRKAFFRTKSTSIDSKSGKSKNSSDYSSSNTPRSITPTTGYSMNRDSPPVAAPPTIEVSSGSPLMARQKKRISSTSQSFSKGDKKRTEQRQKTLLKQCQQNSFEMEIKKSHSFSDLKVLQVLNLNQVISQKRDRMLSTDYDVEPKDEVFDDVPEGGKVSRTASVRRKISNIFRPRSGSGSPE